MSKTMRQQYLDRDISHAVYYRAIAKDAGVSFANETGMQALVKQALAEGDEHLNSIPLAKWDALAMGARLHTSPAFKRAGDFWSMAGGVCVAKQAAIDAVAEVSE
jgi:hypothetical protein